MLFLSAVGLSLHLAVLFTNAAVLERQVSVNPVTTRTPTPSTPPTSMITITRTVITTSTMPPPSPTPIVSRHVFTHTNSGLLSLSTATVTLFPAVSTSTIRRVSTPFVPSATQSASDTDPRNKGAIAGGVLGALAVLVAAFAAFVWFRRRSPQHWRNRAAGRWQTLGDKDVASGVGTQPVYAGAPIYRPHDIKEPVPNPLPPLHIRDRQPVGDPFTDLPSSPDSPHNHRRSGSTSSPTHHRAESSGRFDIELQPTSSQK